MVVWAWVRCMLMEWSGGLERGVHCVIGGSALNGLWLGSGAHVLDGGKISCGWWGVMRGLVVGDWRECVIRRYWVMCRWRFGVPWVVDVSWMVCVSVVDSLWVFFTPFGRGGCMCALVDGECVCDGFIGVGPSCGCGCRVFWIVFFLGGDVVVCECFVGCGLICRGGWSW
jgi:hypothetical protein